MNARTKIILSGLALLSALPAFAQRRPDAVPTMTVMTFTSQEPELGAEAARLLRERLSRTYSERQLNVIPTERVVYILEESGYAPSEALLKNDEIQLGALLKANEFITGSIERPDEKGPYIVHASLVMLRGKEGVVQPLPVIEESRTSRAMDRLRDAIKEARKQAEGERICFGRALSGRAESDPAKRSDFFAQAIDAGRKGIEEYPQATVVRTCMANVYYSLIGYSSSKADSTTYIDSALSVANEIIAIDSLSIPALKIVADLNRVKGDQAASRKALLGLIKADPTNTSLIESVVNELASTGNSKDAVPLVREMLENSPGDAKVLNTAFLVFLDASEFADAVEIGPELIKADTAAADTLYYIRLAQAYIRLEQFQKAADTYAAGSAKFPKNQSLMLFHYAALKEAGKEEQSIDVLSRLVNLDVTKSQPLLLLVNHYLNSAQTDSAISLIQRAEPSITDDSLKKNLGFIVLRQANIQLQAAQTKSDTAAGSKAISLAALADKLSPTAQTKFVTASAHLLAAQHAAMAAETGKSCTLAQSAKQSFTSAMTAFDAIRDDAQFADYLKGMQANIDQLNKAIEYQTGNFCK